MFEACSVWIIDNDSKNPKGYNMTSSTRYRYIPDFGQGEGHGNQRWLQWPRGCGPLHHGDSSLTVNRLLGQPSRRLSGWHILHGSAPLRYHSQHSRLSYSTQRSKCGVLKTITFYAVNPQLKKGYHKAVTDSNGHTTTCFNCVHIFCTHHRIPLGFPLATI